MKATPDPHGISDKVLYISNFPGDGEKTDDL